MLPITHRGGASGGLGVLQGIFQKLCNLRLDVEINTNQIYNDSDYDSASNERLLKIIGVVLKVSYSVSSITC